MKKFLVPATMCVALLACGENEKKLTASEVPKPVDSAFNAKYPGAADVEWEQEMKKGKAVYEVDFKLNDKKKEAEFDSTGTFLEEE